MRQFRKNVSCDETTNKNYKLFLEIFCNLVLADTFNQQVTIRIIYSIKS